MMQHVWVDGIRTPVDDADWSRAAAGFMGRGYRTSFPITTEIDAVANFHRQLATRVTTAFGMDFDEAPWNFIADGELPAGSAVEVVNGWQSSGDPTSLEFGGPTTSWVAITAVEPAPHDALRAEGISLPWTYNSQSPLAGLPLLSRLEDEQAKRHLHSDGFQVGLWWNKDGQLVDSTHGTPLVQVGTKSWAIPDRTAAIRSSWVYFNVTSMLAATPARITRETLEESRTVVFIDSVGKIIVLGSLDGAALSPNREDELEVLTTRLGLIG